MDTCSSLFELLILMAVTYAVGAVWAATGRRRGDKKAAVTWEITKWGLGRVFKR